MAILTWGGLPLLVDGKLTVDPNCCCLEVPPPPCPPCCVRIDWGTFDGDGNLEASYSAGGYTIEMVVELPTPGSRIVCDGQQIVVKWEIIGAPDPGDNNAWIRFGPAWKRIANSPAVESGAGKIYERGLIEFGNQESRTYEGTLELDSCFLDSSVTTWGISVGMDNPSWSQEIEIGRCFKTQFCCTVDQDCPDCCFMYGSSETGWVYTEGKFCKIVQADGYTLIICAESDEPGVVCLPEDGISISVSIIPPRHVTTELFNLKIEWQANWTLGVYSPALGVGGIENDDSPGHVDWGDSIATDYEIDLVSGCSPCDGPEQLDAFGEIEITLNSTELAAPIEDGITFDPCGDQSDCCSNPCDFLTGLFGTAVASSGTATDDEDEECSVDAHWKVNGVPAFYTPRPSPTAGCDSRWIGARCSGINEPGGEDGFEAIFSTEFEIGEELTDCLDRIKLVGSYAADNYVVEGAWKVNGIDQEHIEHGSFESAVTLGCIPFEITKAQGNLSVGTNTIEITVKNGNIMTGGFGGPFGLNLRIECDIEPEE